MTKDQKPKRSYTITERVLTACRLNIKKAQKAALERRFCATRGTDAEHKASHAKLELAAKVKREDRTYKYCSCFRHGLLVADLERSLFMAGESRAEYQAHLGRFEALPGVFGFDAGSDQVKLARACAFASWRRLRAFRLQSEWALRMMVHHLRKAAGERQAGTREGSTGIGAGAGQPLSLTPEQFLELGRGLRWAAESWPGVWRPITRLNNRFDQLWSTLVSQLGEPVPSLNEYFLEWAHMRWSRVVGRFDLYSAEVLGNPLLRPRRLEQLLESRPLEVKPVKDWPCASRPYEVQERGRAELRHREVEAERSGRPVSLMGSLDYRLLREARKPHAESGPPAGASLDAEQAAELPRDFEEFLALVEAAFGEASGVRDQGSGVGFRDSGPGARDSELPMADSMLPINEQRGFNRQSAIQNRQSGTPNPESRVASPEPRTPNPEPRPPAPTLRDLAQLLWDSATLHRRRAEEEARRLAEYLTDYSARLASGDPKEKRRRQDLADRVLKLFRQGISQQEESVVVTRRARLALHDIAVERFGRRPEWEKQLVYSDDRFEQGRGEFFDLYFAEFNRQAAAGDG